MIVAISKRRMVAISDDGAEYPITNLFDGVDETDDIHEASIAIVRRASDAWEIIHLTDFEGVLLQ